MSSDPKDLLKDMARLFREGKSSVQVKFLSLNFQIKCNVFE